MLTITTYIPPPHRTGVPIPTFDTKIQWDPDVHHALRDGTVLVKRRVEQQALHAPPLSRTGDKFYAEQPDAQPARPELGDVELAILHHKEVLDTLEQKRRELQIKLAEIVYPVLNLPTELILCIFVACLPDHGRVRPSAGAAPLLLAQICRQWREIALASCELWSSVDLAIPKDCDRGGYTQLLETWLGRAKDRPLSFTLRAQPRQDVKIPPSLISIITSAAERFHSLELQLSDDDLQLIQHECAALPRLYRLALHPTTRPVVHHPLSIFQRSPLLTDLALWGWPGAAFGIHTLITRLELHQISAAALVEVFRHYPRLPEIKLRGLRDATPAIPSLHITTHHLHVFAVNHPYLDNFTLPGLRRLQFEGEWTELLPFLARSSCSLEHLHLISIGVLPDFRALASLTSFSIRFFLREGMPQLDEVFNADHTLLPHLSTLTISYAYEAFDYLSFIHLLRTLRSRPGTPFSTAHLILSKEKQLTLAAIAQFQELANQGLKLRVADAYGKFAWPAGSFGECEPLHSKSSDSPAFRCLRKFSVVVGIIIGVDRNLNLPVPTKVGCPGSPEQPSRSNGSGSGRF
ncbi:hypothetical protein C8R47DRAFT_1290277 [Mycena vitilis]|nr:hypothetical protein C8R47DRAFT_1290277 [Mycena vitilis]